MYLLKFNNNLDHDEAMIQAFKKVIGILPSVQNKTHNTLITKAWNLSRLNDFKVN